MEKSLESDTCQIHQKGVPTLYPCDAAKGSWFWADDGAKWQEGPSLECSEVEPPLSELLSSVRDVRARRQRPPMLSNCECIIERVRRVKAAVSGKAQVEDSTAAGAAPREDDSLASARASLQAAQQLVEQHAVESPLSESGLKDAIAARDSARAALKEAVSVSLADLPQKHGCATVDELGSLATDASVDAAAAAEALVQAKRSAAEHCGFDATVPVTGSRTVDERLSEALTSVDAYAAAFGCASRESRGTDAAADGLQAMLQHGWLSLDSTKLDGELVRKQVLLLSALVHVERLHWERSTPTFPCAQLLGAGAIAAKYFGDAADRLRAVLEHHDKLHTEHTTLTEQLETRVEALEETLAAARDKLEEAMLDLEEEGTKLKRAKRKSGGGSVDQRIADVDAAKEAVRVAERELSTAHVDLFSQLGAFPELRCRLPDGVPAELLPLLKTGRHIEQYAPREQLSTLSRHAVWKAGFDGRTVALKEYHVDQEALKTCYREAALLRKCHHPAVAELEALFESEGRFYLQMPYYANGTLSELHDKAEVTPRYLLELLLPLGQAVAHLEALGVLHSDIKPDNILIDDEMRPRLADFDVSVPAATRRSAKFAQSTVAGGGGTIGFIAPEVLKGGASELTSKSDVFSLGKSFLSVAVFTALGTGGDSGGGSSSSGGDGSGGGGGSNSSGSSTTPSITADEIRPLRALLNRMTAELPAQRPSAAEVAKCAQAALAELIKLDAKRARQVLDEEVTKLRRQIEEAATAQRDANQDRERLKHLLPPRHWEGTKASAASDGFALIGLDGVKDRDVWCALAELLKTDGTQLGKGQDMKHQSPAYDRLQLAAAWRIEHPALWDKFAGGRRTVALGMKRVLAAGKPARDPACRLHSIASTLPGGLDAESGEEVLLHGTSPSSILSILSTGLNEHFSGASAGTAFGEGIYFAEDCGKNDHYVAMDERRAASSTRAGDCEALHQRLYGQRGRHPGRVFYLLVCRVAAGYIVRTTTKHDANMKSADTGERIFPQVNTPRGPKAVTRELAPVSGLQPPVMHHTLLAESHAGGGPYRYREFVVFQNANVYPEYLIAYQRFNGPNGPQP